MKNSTIRFTAILVSALGTTVLAQQPPTKSPIQQTSASSAPAAPATAAAGTRVAVVNMNSVLKNYAKAQMLNSQIKKKVEGFAKQMQDKRDEMARLQAEGVKPTTSPQQREQYEKQVLAIQRMLQDMDGEARKTIGVEQGNIANQIYREIEQVVKAVAVANGFDLVLSYPDATTESELYSTDNVIRKMANQAAIPIFFKQHIDLTDAVVKTLNASFPVTATTPEAPAKPAAGGATPATGAARP